MRIVKDVLHVLILSLFAALLLSLVPTPGQQFSVYPCDRNEENYKQSNSSDGVFPVISQIICGIHTHRDDINAASTIIIAIFTAVLGIFTGSLARSTRIAADAAKDSADISLRAVSAVEASERPHIAVGVNPIFGFNVSGGVRPSPPRGLLLSFEICNFGKNPAFIREVGLASYAGVNLPAAQPRQKVCSSTFRIWGPDQKEWTNEDVAVTSDDWKTATYPGSPIKLFVYGHIKYTGPTKTNFVTNFAFQYVGHNADGKMYLHPCGPADYWEYT